MHLKKLELVGFKSFSNKTEVLFEPGVTCVVGPNGCGKSNISDGIRWVLGERSAKLLRGSKMEDVIFAGTDFRKPVNFAEVSLSIDNSDQTLPIQYQEVVITRRLHRSGESEYMINRTLCRLKDVQDLILDTGLGTNAYSMIGQGRIDHVLTAEAEERRFLIEEAAGISKYKVKKEEALRKLERTEQNLLRLNDILTEIERNIRYAERQAQRAERYKTQLEEMKALEIRKAFFELESRDAELQKLNFAKSEHETTLKNFEEVATAQNQLLKKLDDEIHLLEQGFFQAEQTRSEAKERAASLETHKQFCSEKIESLKLAAQKALGTIESLKKRAVSLEHEISEKSEEQAGIQKTISNLTAFQDEKKQALESFSTHGSVTHADLKREQEALFDLARDIARLKNSSNRFQAETLSLGHTRANLERTKIKLCDELEILRQRKSGSVEEETAHHSSWEKDRQTADRVGLEREHLDEELRSITAEIERLRKAQYEIESKRGILKGIQRAEGPDPKEVIRQIAAEGGGADQVATLLELIEVDPDYEQAVEAVLADRIRAFVAHDAGTALGLFFELKRTGAHSATILIKNYANQNRSSQGASLVGYHPALVKRLWDVVRVRAGYEEIVRELLGDVYIVSEINRENIGELTNVAGSVTLVSKDGAILGPRFQLTLRNGNGSIDTRVLARNKEASKLSRELEAIGPEIARHADEKKKKEQELARLKKQEMDLRERSTRSEVALGRVRGLNLGVEERLAQIEQELELIGRDLETSATELTRLQSEQEKNQSALKVLEHDEVRASAKLELLESALREHRSAKDNLERDLLQVTGQLEMQSSRANDLAHTAEFLDQQNHETAAQISTLVLEREQARLEIEKLSVDLTRLETEIREADQLLLEKLLAVEQIKRDRSRILGERDTVQLKIKGEQSKLDETRQLIHELHLRVVEINYQKASISEVLQNRYQIQLANINKEEYSLTSDELPLATAEIERLRTKIEAGGSVNLLAIGEYQELKERYDFLLNQKNDLTQARQSLFEAIRKINRTTKKLFDDTLVRVRESFQEYFRTLFKGGQADLISLDELNPLDSGLDILARPPGKKLQHINLLSGGEKALTAIALLFALFSVRPSPFCVLDEVDAPLDEANTDRFLNVLAKFLPTTQFVIITHCRKTIAVGDSLYGVTMEEPGVSKIVSVRLATDNSIHHENTEVKNQLNQILN